MSADILTNPSYPHGTAAGFTDGCRGSHCPAPVACKVVYARYQGDWAFRRQVDAGTTPAEILAREAEAAEALALAEKAAVLAEKQKRAAAAREAARVRHNRARREKRKITPGSTGKTNGDGIPRTPLQIEVHRLHSQNLTDKEIAEHLGKSRNQVKGIRSYLQLKPNPALASAGASSSQGDA